jgi:hypothetical protein
MRAQVTEVHRYPTQVWTETVGGKAKRKFFYHALEMNCHKCKTHDGYPQVVRPIPEFTSGGWTPLLCPECKKTLGHAYLRKIPWKGVMRKKPNAEKLEVVETERKSLERACYDAYKQDGDGR